MDLEGLKNHQLVHSSALLLKVAGYFFPRGLNCIFKFASFFQLHFFLLQLENFNVSVVHDLAFRL